MENSLYSGCDEIVICKYMASHVLDENHSAKDTKFFQKTF